MDWSAKLATVLNYQYKDSEALAATVHNPFVVLMVFFFCTTRICGSVNKHVRVIRLCIPTYVHTNIRTYIHTYVHMYAHTSVYVCVYLYIYISIYIHNVHIHIYTHVYLRVCLYTYFHVIGAPEVLIEIGARQSCVHVQLRSLHAID